MRKPVQGFPGYEADETGRVYGPSGERVGECGRLHAADESGRRRAMLTGAMVMRAFVGPCPHGRFLSFSDGDKRNARPFNLCYEAKVGSGRKLDDDDAQKIQEAVALRKGLTNAALARKYGVSVGTIASVARGRERKPWPIGPDDEDVLGPIELLPTWE